MQPSVEKYNISKLQIQDQDLNKKITAH